MNKKLIYCKKCLIETPHIFYERTGSKGAVFSYARCKKCKKVVNL